MYEEFVIWRSGNVASTSTSSIFFLPKSHKTKNRAEMMKFEHNCFATKADNALHIGRCSGAVPLNNLLTRQIISLTRHVINSGAFVYKVAFEGGSIAQPLHQAHTPKPSICALDMRAEHLRIGNQFPESHPSPQMEILRFDRGRQIFAEMIFTLIKNLCNVKISRCWCPSALFIHCTRENFSNRARLALAECRIFL